MLHSDIFPEHGCYGDLIALSEHCTATLKVLRCDSCFTEFRDVVDDGNWVTVVYPGMKESMDRG